MNPGPKRRPAFCSDNKLLPVIGYQFPQNGFSHPATVNIRTVKKIDAIIQTVFENRLGCGLVSFAPKSHRSHTELRDPDACIAQ
jgi:hypothetical protein